MKISELLDKNEKILWQGKPDRIVYSLRSIFLTFFGFFFAIPSCSVFLFPLGFLPILGLFTGASQNIPESSMPSEAISNTALGFGSIFSMFNCSFLCFSIPFVLISLFLVFSPVIQYFVWENVQYAVTSKRVILSSGLIGKDFKSIDHDQIKNISVNVGVIDKLFNKNTGSVRIFSGESRRGEHGTYSVSDTMYGIQDPYKVFKNIKEIAHDIKTDIEYPNELRPKNNPGYQTEYNPED